MKKKKLIWGCLFGCLFGLILLGIGGGWWFLRLQGDTSKSKPESPVQVFLLSPASGAEMKAGDFIPVDAMVFAPEGIQNAELFVDGQSLGVTTDSPENASWSWQAWPVGVHILSARATQFDGQVGESQKVIVNVLAGDGNMQISAQEGQTLTQIGENFGVPPDQMAGANPHIDPTIPLQEGQPVQVPVGDAGAANGSAQGGGNIPNLITIKWKIKITQPVDQSYCYISNGNGQWDKIPKEPFVFFQGLDSLYTQLIPSAQPVVIQVQCWGWLGGNLKYLGVGETSFDFSQSQLTIAGKGFQFTGTSNLPLGNEPQAKILGPEVPAPYALREPTSLGECEAHDVKGDNICKNAMNVPLKQNIVLIWEWQPGLNFPGKFGYANDIAGYHIYEIDPTTKTFKLMKDSNYPGIKVATVPLPWGIPCYGVEAYAQGPQYGGMIVSKMTTYCTGQTPATQQITLTPSDWLITGGTWVSQSCPFEQPHYASPNKPELVVGSYVFTGDCFEQGDYSSDVKFANPVLPPGAIVQKAVLKFSKTFTEYSATGKALGIAPYSCVAAVGMVKQAWNGFDSIDHYSNHHLNSSPFTSISSWAAPSVDVTSVVSDWIKHPVNNKGFTLKPLPPPEPDEGGEGKCLSGLDNFQLVIDFYAP